MSLLELEAGEEAPESVVLRCDSEWLLLKGGNLLKPIARHVPYPRLVTWGASDEALRLVILGDADASVPLFLRTSDGAARRTPEKARRVEVVAKEGRST